MHKERSKFTVKKTLKKEGPEHLQKYQKDMWMANTHVKKTPHTISRQGGAK